MHGSGWGWVPRSRDSKVLERQFFLEAECSSASLSRGRKSLHSAKNTTRKRSVFLPYLWRSAAGNKTSKLLEIMFTLADPTCARGVWLAILYSCILKKVCQLERKRCLSEKELKYKRFTLFLQPVST